MKPIPKGNKGLPKLPKKVRNDMGFLQMGGMMPMEERKINPTTGMAMRYGGMPKGKPRTGHMDMRKNGMFYGGMANRKMK
tara:strand:- start:85 stop:324 length:240 start_codon:yes stop_codon:yes gene_type:complete